MKRYDPRLWIGGILIFIGALTLLDNLDIISDVSDIFWGIVWVLWACTFYIHCSSSAKTGGRRSRLLHFLGLLPHQFFPDPWYPSDSLVFFAGISLAFLGVFCRYIMLVGDHSCRGYAHARHDLCVG